MIQDIAPHIFRNHYTEQQPEKSCVFCYIKDGKLLLKRTEEGICYPSVCLMGGPQEYVYLFSLDETLFFLYLPEEPEDTETDSAEGMDGAKEAETKEKKADGIEAPEADGYEYMPAGSFRSLSPRHLAFAGITAIHLRNWYANNRYCGRCGHPTRRDHKERMLRCPNCGNMIYPRISPAVIVAVTKGDSILLTKYAGRTYAKYALIAGYTEIGETAEETVAREVMEEAGISVKNIRYYKSQPWGFSETLLLGYFCEVDGDSTICMDEEELSVARWVKREEISQLQESFDDISLTNEMICRFRDGQEKESAQRPKAETDPV